MREQLVLHLVELLDDPPLIKVFLDFFFGCNLLRQHWIDQVLEHLPEEEKVVALGDHVLHVEEVLRGAGLVQKFLQTLLVLLCDRLVHLQHGEHQVPDFFYSDDLESFVKEFDYVSGGTGEQLICPVVNLDAFVLRLFCFSRENVENHGQKHAMNFDRVGIAQGHEAIVECVVSTAVLRQRVVILVGPVNHLQCLVRVEVDCILLPIVSQQFQYVCMGQVHIEANNVGSLLGLCETGIKRRH